MIHGVERAFLFMGYSILLAHAAQMLLPPKKLPLNQAFGEDPEIWVSVGINELSDTHKRQNGNDDSSYKIATSSCLPIRKDNFDAMVGGLSELAHLIRYWLKDETMRKLVALEVAIFRQRDWEQDEGLDSSAITLATLGGICRQSQRELPALQDMQKFIASEIKEARAQNALDVYSLPSETGAAKRYSRLCWRMRKFSNWAKLLKWRCRGRRIPSYLPIRMVKLGARKKTPTSSKQHGGARVSTFILESGLGEYYPDED
jgi:hypothetical protein